MKRFMTVLLGAMAMLATGCLDRVAGTTSTGNTGKGTIAGRVVGADGKGVANARVNVVGVDHDPGPGGSGNIDAIAFTELDGSFRTDSLPDGKYNLLDAKAGQVAFVDSVAVDGDSAARAGDAVLGAPGTVTGVVRLRAGDDSRTVFLVLIGTTTFTVAKDSIGNFSLAGLAAGEYRLRLLSTLDAYAPMDTVIRVTAGRETVLPDTLRLAYLGPEGLPVVDNPSLAFDSALVTVRVSWHAQDPTRVAGYHVYRRATDSGFVLITAVSLKDTFFVDGWDQGFRPGQAYDYAVTALDSRGNEGLKGFASRIFTDPQHYIDTLSALPVCPGPLCPSDVDPAGTVWMIESDSSMVGLTASGRAYRWPLSMGNESWALSLRADDSGAIYVLAAAPTRVRKYDTLGRFQWELPLDRAIGVCREECLFLKDDTVLVWDSMNGILTSISRNGVLLGRDTLLSSATRTAGAHATVFMPGIGFVGIDTSGDLIMLDRKGNVADRWDLPQQRFILEYTVDPLGRWYLIWSDARLEYYSADRKLLRTIEVPQAVRRIEYRFGSLYARTDRAMLRIGSVP